METVVRRHQPSQRRLGQSLAEFALLLPLLTVLTMGAVDLARVFYARIVIANASRVAATYAVNYNLLRQFDNDAAQASLAVRQRAVAEAGGLVPLAIGDVAFNGTWAPGSVYTVAVTARWSPVTPLVGQLWGGGPLTLAHATTLRHNCAATLPCDYTPVRPTETPSPTPSGTAVGVPTTTPTPTATAPGG